MYRVILAALAVCLLLSACGGGASEPVAPNMTVSSGTQSTYTLWAGQDIDVGEVHIWADATTVNVDYELSDGWLLTEVHMDVFEDELPSNYKPIPGQMLAGASGLLTDEYTLSTPNTWGSSATLVVVPHCKVMGVIGDGVNWQYATSIPDSLQGERVDHSAVLPERSNTDSILGSPSAPAPPGCLNFYSLGFDIVATEEVEGWVDVSFGYPILNHPNVSDDAFFFEVTNGSYPTEIADIYAFDGSDFVYCGSVNNKGITSVPIPDSLDCIEYIRVVDHSDPGLFPGNGDGYDLNAVGVKYLCTGQDESAFGGDEEGSGPRWYFYFTWDLNY